MARVTPRPDSFDEHVLPNRCQPVSAGAHCPPVRTAAHTLETFTDPASVRVEQKYNWRTGNMEEHRGDILTNARRHMTRLKTHAETAVRTHPHDNDLYCAGMGTGTVYGNSALKGKSPLAKPIPLSGGKRKKDRGK